MKTMQCRKCNAETKYSICAKCANDEEKKHLERLEEIDRFIADELEGIKEVKSMKKTRSNKFILGAILTLIGISFIWVGQVWFSIIGFFILVPGLGFLVTGMMLEVFPDKLARMDYYDDSKKRIKKLKLEKKSITDFLKKGKRGL